MGMLRKGPERVVCSEAFRLFRRDERFIPLFAGSASWERERERESVEI